jgi:hypothetical protein
MTYLRHQQFNRGRRGALLRQGVAGMEVDPRHAQWQLAGATAVSIGAAGFIAVLIAVGTNPKLDLLATATVERALLVSDFLAVTGAYAVLGPIWNLPLPGPRQVEHRSAWWYAAPVGLLLLSEFAIWRFESTRKSASTVPSAVDVWHALAGWPAYVAFLLVILILYWVTARKIAARIRSVAPLESALNLAVETGKEVVQENGQLRDENATLQKDVDTLGRERGAARAQLDAVQRELAEAPSRTDMEKLLQERDDLQRECDASKASQSLLTEIESWLGVRSGSRPAAPETITTAHDVHLALPARRYDSRTVAIYKEVYESRVRDRLPRALEHGRARDDIIETVIAGSPETPSDIQRIVNYLRYLESGSTERK